MEKGMILVIIRVHMTTSIEKYNIYYLYIYINVFREGRGGGERFKSQITKKIAFGRG